MSRFSKLNNTTKLSIFIFILLIILGISYYFLFKDKYSSKPTYQEMSDSIEKLNLNPEYLREENLLIIRSMPTIEFLRTRYLHHKFESADDPVHKTKLELETDFPGEKGRVLSEIFMTYLRFLSEKEKIDSSADLDEFQKLNKMKEIRKEIFGENLEVVLFPEQSSDKIFLFYAYTERYLKKHHEDEPRFKRDHLQKARREIYGDEFETLALKEPFHKRFELELKIEEREMSILSVEERKEKISRIKEDLRKSNLD
ncbi:MAG: hypothetical protein SFU98_08390 [Leptospiraceae bacterium]|nr:hypothetical protein [Leptospiraceae bacterium]